MVEQSKTKRKLAKRVIYKTPCPQVFIAKSKDFEKLAIIFIHLPIFDNNLCVKIIHLHSEKSGQSFRLDPLKTQ